MASYQSGGSVNDHGDLITEGKAQAYLPGNVFYNPVQEFNRDLTIAVISEYGRLIRLEAKNKKDRQAIEDSPDEVPSQPSGDDDINVTVKRGLEDEREAGIIYNDGLIILEGLAATGLRSVRFSKEIPGLKKVIANDFDRKAVKIMNENVKVNDVGDLMETSCNDAAMLMYESSRGKFKGLPAKTHFNVIDLDPYGGPTKFLDASVQAIDEGGLMCITCTDMAILCGNASEKCYAAYGSMSLKSKTCHEIALRIVLHTIDSYANRYSKYIVPLISVSVDFYCRVFVRVFSGAAKVKDSASKMAMVYECTGCGVHTLQPMARIVRTKSEKTGQVNKKFTFAKGPPVDRLCEHCKHTHHIAGPLWAESLHDTSFVQSVINRVQCNKSAFGTADRIIGMMSLVSEELQDVPLYYLPDQLAGVLHCTSPGFVPFRSAILHAGYRVSLSHAHKSSLKTDAPPNVIWDILRCWAKKSPVHESRLIDGTPCATILSKEPELTANFEPHEAVKPQSMKDKLLRFQTGKKDWGPKARASEKTVGEQTDKRKLNQNKRADKRRRLNPDTDYKKYTCGTFRRDGNCPYGDDCRYSHDISITDQEMIAEKPGVEEITEMDLANPQEQMEEPTSTSS